MKNVDLNLREHSSFEELISRRDIRAPVFDSNLKAMEGVELMSTTCQLGDRVLALARIGTLTPQQAESLLNDLISCFTDPMEHAKRVLQIGKELKGYEK